ncbi:MAG: hypothetical protein QOE59_4227 [Actinomycetota bacterium]|nr:hypothetical protein [Actinomycetota bacterium]
MVLNRLDDSGHPLEVPDVQRTTLGMDLMSRFVCNSWHEAIANGGPDFDAVVLGAGMFGAYCASKIVQFGADAPLRVLVLDAGPFLLPTHVQNLPPLGLYPPTAALPADDTGAARNLVWGLPWRGNVPWVGQAYCVGGKSLFWGGWCPRLLERDLSMWPAGAADYLREHYELLEEQSGVAATTDFIEGPLFDAVHGKLVAASGQVPHVDSAGAAPLAVQGQAPTSGLFGFDKYNAVTLLADAARSASRLPDSSRPLFVVPNTHVTRLTYDGGRVTAIEVFTDGTTERLAVGEKTAVIIALGTVESTRLALSSFPSRATPDEELMGRNLMAHWRTNTYARIPRTALDPTGSLPRQLEAAAAIVRGSTDTGVFHVQVTASADPAGDSDRFLYAMIPDLDQQHQLLATQTADSIALAFRGVSEMFGDTLTNVPNETGRWINLSEEKDEFGQRRAWVQMSSSPTEDDLATAMEASIRAIAVHLADGDENAVQVTSQGRDGMGTTYHEAGTLWMGDDPGSSVTDSRGRFHHVANTFCADQSIFPTVGSVNPTLTGLVLSRRVAEAVVNFCA